MNFDKLRPQTRREYLQELKQAQRRLADRLSIPKKKQYYLPVISKSNMNHPVFRPKAKKKSLSINKENLAKKNLFGSVCFKAKGGEAKRARRKMDKFLRITKGGPVMFKSSVSNRIPEFL